MMLCFFHISDPMELEDKLSNHAFYYFLAATYKLERLLGRDPSSVELTEHVAICGWSCGEVLQLFRTDCRAGV